MSSISLDLSNKVPAEQLNIIRQVVHAAQSNRLRLFVVGAQARDLLLQYAHDLPVYRATNDIDFGLAVEGWDEFTKLREDLIATSKFEPDKGRRQRLIHESGYFIDLVPFGGLEEITGQISWPPDFSIVMSTVGFREAYDNSVEILLSDDLVVRVASLAGLALMKIVAWDDRNFERDAQDLDLIMRHYLDAGNQDRIYSEHGDCIDLLNEEFDYERASARMLGRDIGRILINSSRAIVWRVVSDDGSASVVASVMIKHQAHRDYETAVAMLAELRTGIFEVGEPRLWENKL